MGAREHEAMSTAKDLRLVTLHAEHPDGVTPSLSFQFVTADPPDLSFGTSALGVLITADVAMIPVAMTKADVQQALDALLEDAHARWFEKFMGAGEPDPVEALRNEMRRAEQNTANRFDRLTQLVERLITDRAVIPFDAPGAGIPIAPALAQREVEAQRVAANPRALPEEPLPEVSPIAALARASNHPLMSEPAPRETLPPGQGRVETGPGQRHARPDGSGNSAEITSGRMVTAGPAAVSTVFTIGADGSPVAVPATRVGNSFGTRSDI